MIAAPQWDHDGAELELAHVPAEASRWFERNLAAGWAVGDRLAIHRRLVETEVLEAFLGARFVTAKRFSIEGCDALVPLVEAILDASIATGSDEIVIGAPHRGRLALLVALGIVTPAELLAMFAGTPDGVRAEHGDVRYHKGGVAMRGGARVSFVPNPSHVEWVDPVVIGRARALRDRGRRALPLLLHGDGAVVGQGVTAETLNLARLDGYTVGGTIHVIVDNEIAFTTSARDGRSSRHPSDVARMIGAPVLRVDADRPEMAVALGRLAARYRAERGEDVFVHLVGYRRRGHNEADEPRFTQPLEYRAIDERESVRRVHARALEASGASTLAASDAEVVACTDTWRNALASVREQRESIVASESSPPRAPVAAVDIASLARAFACPAEVSPHPKIAALLADRARAVRDRGTVDIATAETLAFASLLAAGVAVRISGQDTRRGTFAQRHAVVIDQSTGIAHAPLAALGTFTAIDSPLSEAAALGFEYGYSVERRNALVVWEAQYGDFANAAQVIIDTFLAAGRQRWGIESGLVLLLPHGHEGQGPDHSSARLERFLELSANDNWRVCQPSTAAQVFHLLRSQVGRPDPLVILTPKALLRAARSASPIAELEAGELATVIGTGEKAPRVVLCAGSLYYALLDAAPRDGSVELVRIEQLYPLPASVMELVARRRDATIVWAQEEPRNLGAWRYLADRLEHRIECVARPESAAPSGGSRERHLREQEQLIARALGRA